MNGLTRNAKIAIGAALAGAFALGAIIVANPSGADEAAPAGDSFSESQQNEIRAIVEGYILDNPQIILESVRLMQEREEARMQAETLAAAGVKLEQLLDPTHGYVAAKNPDAAKVAVIEFYDYHCGYCKRATPVVRDLIEKDQDVKFVFRELPILRKESEDAAKASLAAREQGKFLELHFGLMAAQGVLNEARITNLADKSGLDVERLQQARKDEALDVAIAETRALSRELGIAGTPAFIIASLDGAYINIVPGFDQMALVNSIAEAKKAMN